ASRARHPRVSRRGRARPAWSARRRAARPAGAARSRRLRQRPGRRCRGARRAGASPRQGARPLSFARPILLLALGVLPLWWGLRIGMLEDGTAIGTGIATAANRLRRAPGKSKVIVLLTDGVNNRGTVDPRTAAQAAAALGIKIYVIGVGKRGEAPVPTGQGLE